MSSTDKVVLSYGDTVVRESDVELLKGPYWLNDVLISFYFEYLTRKVFKHRKDTLFVSPEVTHCIKASKYEELPIFLDPLNAKNMRYVLFALNDHRTFEQSGGTHWSLLVYSERDSRIYHVDSMSGVNTSQAQKLAAKLFSYLSKDNNLDFEELPCLLQDNGYDCGIFVLAHAQHLLEKCENGYTIENSPKLSMDVIKQKRSDILHIITKLAGKS